MVVPEDPEEVYYGRDECGTCHAKLDNGKHLCMVDFVVPRRHRSDNIQRSICGVRNQIAYGGCRRVQRHLLEGLTWRQQSV